MNNNKQRNLVIKSFPPANNLTYIRAELDTQLHLVQMSLKLSTED